MVSQPVKWFHSYVKPAIPDSLPTPNFAVHPIIRKKYSRRSHCSHFEGSDEELVALAEANWHNRMLAKGYDAWAIPVSLELGSLKPKKFFAWQKIWQKKNRVQKPAALSFAIIVHSKARLLADNDKEGCNLKAKHAIVALHGYIYPDLPRQD